jgi:hypothetical protein
MRQLRSQAQAKLKASVNVVLTTKFNTLHTPV